MSQTTSFAGSPVRHAHKVRGRKSHAPLRLNAVGERPNGVDRTFQNRAFQTVIVIEMDMRCRHHKFMVFVLQRHEPPRQRAHMMIVNVG